MYRLALLAMSTTVNTLALSGCGGPMSGLSDQELKEQSLDCRDLGGSRKIKSLTCEEVRKECLKRREQGRWAC